MERRTFLRETLSISAAASVVSLGQRSEAADEKGAPASAAPVLQGLPVLTGPAGDALSILQALGGPATGFVELKRAGQPWQRIDAERGGLLPYDRFVLKFRLPPLESGEEVAYRVTAAPVDFQNAYKILRGEAVTSPELTFRVLNGDAPETRFVVWNDTHENLETISALQRETQKIAPAFATLTPPRSRRGVEESQPNLLPMSPNTCYPCPRSEYLAGSRSPPAGHWRMPAATMTSAAPPPVHSRGSRGRQMTGSTTPSGAVRSRRSSSIPVRTSRTTTPCSAASRGSPQCGSGRRTGWPV